MCVENNRWLLPSSFISNIIPYTVYLINNPESKKNNDSN